MLKQETVCNSDGLDTATFCQTTKHNVLTVSQNNANSFTLHSHRLFLIVFSLLHRPEYYTVYTRVSHVLTPIILFVYLNLLQNINLNVQKEFHNKRIVQIYLHASLHNAFEQECNIIDKNNKYNLLFILCNNITYYYIGLQLNNIYTKYTRNTLYYSIKYYIINLY